MGLKTINIMEEKWDYLIILDACRVDYFEHYNRIEGTLKTVLSNAPSTGLWRIRTFTKEYYEDVIYVSGNPFLSEYFFVNKEGRDKVPFFILDEVWSYDWNDEWNTVLPDKITNATIELIRQFPNKRMIIHYMQPHHPFLSLGKTKHYDRGLAREYYEIKGVLTAREETERMKPIIYNMLSQGAVSEEEVREGYRNNLILVLQEVEKLIEFIPKDKLIVITSDHSEYLGFSHEDCPKAYGHSHEFDGFVDCKKVPWFVVDRNA